MGFPLKAATSQNKRETVSIVVKNAIVKYIWLEDWSFFLSNDHPREKNWLPTEHQTSASSREAAPNAG
jgi:hypothetical protein